MASIEGAVPEKAGQVTVMDIGYTLHQALFRLLRRPYPNKERLKACRERIEKLRKYKKRTGLDFGVFLEKEEE